MTQVADKVKNPVKTLTSELDERVKKPEHRANPDKATESKKENKKAELEETKNQLHQSQEKPATEEPESKVETTEKKSTELVKKETDKEEKSKNTGAQISKGNSLGSAATNLLSSGLLLSSIFRGYFEKKTNILGLKKGKENEFAYGDKKLSDKKLPLGEKLGWLTFKVGYLFNAIATLTKYLNTKNLLGTVGGILSVISVPIQEKIVGTLLGTVAYAFVNLGMSKEGEKDHLKRKEEVSMMSLFNVEDFVREIVGSFQDTYKFLKNPFKHIPFLNKDSNSEVLMKAVSILNTKAAFGGLLGIAFNNKIISKLFITIDKGAAAIQSFTAFTQALKDKWENSTPGTSERLSAIYQAIGSFFFTFGELIYDSKLGKALITLGSGLYGLKDSLLSLTHNEANDKDNPNAKNLNTTTGIIGVGSLFVGLLTGLFFNKPEKANNPINKALRLIELNS